MSSFFSAILEEGYDVPKIPKLDLKSLQLESIAANQAAAPGAQALAADQNKFNLNEWLKAIKFGFPQYEQARDLVVGNAMSMARGEIPQSDLNMLQIRDAAKAYGGGYSGSGMHGALVARDIGQTQVGLRMAGQNALQSWLSQLKTPAPFDMSSMFITPTQLYQTKNEQNMQQFQRKYMANVVDAHYSWSSRIGRGLDEALDIALSIYGMNKGQQPSQNQT